MVDSRGFHARILACTFVTKLVGRLRSSLDNLHGSLLLASAHDFILSIATLAQKRRQLIVYALIGVSGVALDFILFNILIYTLNLDFRVANLISVNSGIINNFTWNSLLNFRVKDKILKRFALFYAVGLLGLAVSHILLVLGINHLGLDATVSKALCLIVVLALQYNLNRLLAFRRT